jgi:hypothetical protein
MSAPSLSEIKRLHNLMLDGTATQDVIERARSERNRMIGQLTDEPVCPRCMGSGELLGPPTWVCPDCEGTGNPPSQAGIARELGISRERVRQIVSKT